MAQWTPPFDDYLVVSSPLLVPQRPVRAPGGQRMALVMAVVAVVVLALIAIRPAPALSGSGALEAAPALPVAETVEVAPAMPEGVQRVAKISHYWPPLGGVNCARFAGGKCVSRMAN